MRDLSDQSRDSSEKEDPINQEISAATVLSVPIVMYVSLILYIFQITAHLSQM